jgi:hypothetical protein
MVLLPVFPQSLLSVDTSLALKHNINGNETIKKVFLRTTEAISGQNGRNLSYLTPARLFSLRKSFYLLSNLQNICLALSNKLTNPV